MNLPPQVVEFTERMRNWWNEAGQVQRIAMVGGSMLLAILVVFGMVRLVSDPQRWDGAILYADLDYQEAAEVSRRLSELQVSHRLTADASALLVPQHQVRQLRLQLAGEGFPKTGRMGYKIFDETRLTMTDFLQKVSLKRALQEELEKTLESLDGVRGARVHLVLPEPSLFTEDRKPVTASVTLNLAKNASLKRARIDAIVYLVSASVEGLDMDNVVIVDATGNLLSTERDPLVKMANKQFELQLQVERALETKVQSLLNQVIGADRSRVRLHVSLDFSQTTTQLQTVDPGPTQVLISEDTREKSSAEFGSEEQAVRNYEINRTVKNIVGAVGTIQRLSMALTVDQTKLVLDPESGRYVEEPRSQEEIDSLANLAREAVGFDASRGDQFTVYPIHFDKTQEMRARQQAEAEQRKEFWTNIGINLAKILGIVAMLIILRFIIQAIGRGVGVEEELEVLSELRPEAEQGEFAGAAMRPTTPHDMLMGRVQQMAREHPEDAAKLIRTMLLEQSG